MRFLPYLVLMVGLTSSLSAQAKLSADLGLSAKADAGLLSTREVTGFAVRSDLFDIEAVLSMNSDGKYGADIANFRDTHTFFKNYFLMESGYTSLHLDPVEFQIGRIRQADGFVSPYSLFLNSQNPSAVGAILRYRDPVFTYESRWIRLNDRSSFGDQATPAWSSVNGGSDGYPDRGANIKTLTFTLGDQRLGLQDSAVYTQRSFDLEYFLSPVPEYFTQYFYGTVGRPWTTNSNENNLIGLFWTWDTPDFHLGAQVLIDDFSLYFLFPAQVPNNPWKAAWTLGGEVPTEYGVFGFHHAGALKYTFEPIDSNRGSEPGSAYGYTLYPDTRYGIGSSEFRPFVIEDNALGYLHGENNLALMATYRNTFDKAVEVSSSVEVLLAGANSPTNPWQDDTGSHEVGTHWIDDPVLQQSLVWSGQVRWALGDWEFSFEAKLGGIWHALTLQDPVGTWNAKTSNLDRYSLIYKPSNDNKLVAMAALGASYHWDLSAALAGRSAKAP